MSVQQTLKREVYVTLGETAMAKPVKIAVLEVKEAEYVKTEWAMSTTLEQLCYQASRLCP